MKNGDKPISPVFDGSEFVNHLGLTKREYFAALAMQGMMTSQDENGTWRHDIKQCAKNSVLMADVLLAELDKK
jgi:hypothetical protein